MLAELHAKSIDQMEELRRRKNDETNPDNEAHRKRFLSDKLVGLDRDKAELRKKMLATSSRLVLRLGCPPFISWRPSEITCREIQVWNASVALNISL
ncbi:MAG TPA: hypothetical protein VHB49_03135 [Bradyrhizobium sp.]|nr:hypothetical protein [Bradyrhizobium sp.]